MKPGAADLERARALIAQRLGLSLSGVSAEALARVLSDSELDLSALASLSAGSPQWGRLAARLTVGETYFFRDEATFAMLAEQVLPALIAARRAAGRLQLRLWSAGCSTSEEPYSLAILLQRLLPDRSDWDITILASDVNPRALEVAERGVYRPWSFRAAPARLQALYFRQRAEERYELRPDIRRMVTFRLLNLAEAVYPSPWTNTVAMDLILCRNVLMYFTPDAALAAAQRLAAALAPGGWLAVAAAEASVQAFRPLTPVQYPGANLFRRHRPRPVAPLAPPPLPAPPLPPATAPETDPMEQARALADQGRLAEARSLCEAALQRDGLRLEGHLLLAAICQEQDDLPRALQALRHAIYLDPHCAPAHLALGSLLLRLGDLERGLRSLAAARDCMQSHEVKRA